MPTVRFMGYNEYGTNVSYLSAIDYFYKKNNFKMADYHRLDLGMQYHKKYKHFNSTLCVGVYNVYNRKNPYFYYLDHDDNNNRVLTRVSLFQFIPSVAYNISF